MKKVNRNQLKEAGLNCKLLEGYNKDTLERTPKVAKKICLKDNKIKILFDKNVYILNNINYYNLISNLIEDTNEITSEDIEIVQDL